MGRVPPLVRRAVRELPRRRSRARAAPLPADARTAPLTRALELHDAAGAFETLEAFLDAEGFWGRAGVEADLYLGYGLAQALRRPPAPAPPEPCRLPLLFCRIRPVATGRMQAHSLELRGEWSRSWTDEGYTAAIESVRAAIARGDVYQVNLVQHLSAPCNGDAAALAAALAHLGPLVPRPLVGDGWAIVSASPELFLSRRGRRLTTKPIKGTRPEGEDVDDPKDAAEHMMIVDLERNDLARVCEPGSIRWPRLMEQRRLAGVTHLVSTVEGTLRPDAGLAEILAATFPGGSVTGAPKLAALEQIAALEPVGRGASMGAFGVLRPDGDFELALTIRTFALAGGRLHLWAGGGIVWDSDPEAEIEESWVKARPLLAAIGALGPPGVGSTQPGDERGRRRRRRRERVP